MSSALHPAPLEGIGRELAGVLVPYLAARTRELGLELCATGTDGGARLEEESATLGFALALLATGCGIDVLHHRRERRGLRLVLDLLAQAEERPTQHGWEHLPELARGAPMVDAALLVGWTWHRAARAGRADEWTQHLDADTWWFSIPDVLHEEPVLREEGTAWRWKREGARVGLAFPRAWIRSPA